MDPLFMELLNRIRNAAGNYAHPPQQPRAWQEPRIGPAPAVYDSRVDMGQHKPVQLPAMSNVPRMPMAKPLSNMPMPAGWDRKELVNAMGDMQDTPFVGPIQDEGPQQPPEESSIGTGSLSDILGFGSPDMPLVGTNNTSLIGALMAGAQPQQIQRPKGNWFSRFMRKLA